MQFNFCSVALYFRGPLGFQFSTVTSLPSLNKVDDDDDDYYYYLSRFLMFSAGKKRDKLKHHSPCKVINRIVVKVFRNVLIKLLLLP